MTATRADVGGTRWVGTGILEFPWAPLFRRAGLPATRTGRTAIDVGQRKTRSLRATEYAKIKGEGSAWILFI